VAEKCLAERRRSPVEHRHFTVEHAARPEEIRALAALRRDREISLRGRDRGDGTFDRVEVHGGILALGAKRTS
jgi:hypothetical protein